MKTILLSTALLISAGSLAAPKLDMTPGKWQHSVKMQSASGEMERAMAEMQKQLASMPPQQRQMMEAMMKSQGMNLNPDGVSLEVCLTAEDIARGQLPQQDGCTQQLTEQNGRYHISFQCSNPPSKGEGDFQLLDSKTYQGNLQVETKVKGKTEVMTMQQQGKWLGACS